MGLDVPRALRMGIVSKFARGLSPTFVADLLHGTSAPVLAACRAAGLDVRLRENYWNAYDAGRSVAKIAWAGGAARLVVHRKYLHTDAFPGVKRTAKKDYVYLPVVDRLARQFDAELPRLRLQAAGYARTEERDEVRLLRDNDGDVPVSTIDRQVQVPGTRRTLDVVGVTTSGTPTLALVEIKRDRDNRIQQVPVQLARYLDIFVGAGGGLRADIASSLALVAGQLAELGFAAPSPSRFHAGMPVVGLVVLVRYDPSSDLLNRANRAARNLAHPIWCWRPHDHTRLRLPPPEEWVRMR